MGLTPTRKIAIGATVAATAAALTGIGIAAAPSSSAAAGCGVLFDDFNYSSAHRRGAGPARLEHPQQHRRPRRAAARAGSPTTCRSRPSTGRRSPSSRRSPTAPPAGTSHAEFSQSNRRFFEGTYLARIKFADAPASGADGDHVNQTFYTISPLAAPRDPLYSELDFSEYLPNGGWGEAGPINYQTTWYTYVADPWYADNQHSQQARSINGWHDVMATVAGGHVKYYIDGALVGDHSGKVYPRQNMSIDFNQWFIDLAGHAGGTSTYLQSVDYVYHAKKQVLSPAQATAAINGYRSGGTTHTDNVVTTNDCDPGTPPATNPPPTTPPATGATMLQSNFSGRCIDIPGGRPTAGALPADVGLQRHRRAEVDVPVRRHPARDGQVHGPGRRRPRQRHPDPAGRLQRQPGAAVHPDRRPDPGERLVRPMRGHQGLGRQQRRRAAALGLRRHRQPDLGQALTR